MYEQFLGGTISPYHTILGRTRTPALSGDIMDPKYIKAFHEINERPGVSLQVSCRFAQFVYA